VTAVELLENLNLLDEHEQVEAKRTSEAGKSVLETVCAFANEPGLGGGWIMLGVVREDLALFPAYEIEGITHPDKITSDIASQCRDMFNIPIRVNISTENIQGKNVVVVFVPELQPQDKPAFSKAQGLPKGAFRRIGSTDQRCTDDDLAVFCNPKIAAVLHETRFAETKGSGIRVMRESMEQAGLTPPLFESDRGNDQFVARYFFHHFLGEEDIAWLTRFRDLHLTDEEAKALIVVREAGAIDNATYRDLCKVDTLTASQALRRLRDAGLLAQKGRGSATYYVPTERLAVEVQGLSSNPPALSSNPPALSSNPPGLSDETSRLPAKFDETLRITLLDNLPGSLAARLGGIGQRHPPQEIRELVVALCALRDWHVDELSVVLRRNPEVVRQNYLRPLMRDGRLTMTNPVEPNDPQQAYRTLKEKA
jgi:predicted HTH transcriptional regulator